MVIFLELHTYQLMAWKDLTDFTLKRELKDEVRQWVGQCRPSVVVENNVLTFNDDDEHAEHE